MILSFLFITGAVMFGCVLAILFVDRLEDVLWPSSLSTDLTNLKESIDKMTPELQKLQTEVAEAKTVMQGAAVLMSGLSQQLRDAKDDPAKILELANDLDGSSNELAQAIVDNTPTVSDPPPVDPPA